ncbi:MAG: hypothetical protein KDJ75_03585 [Alphaproteobacteria bacterium]|nr:hypothetical protein [Alphaproteobacteria bacterium]
MRIFIFALMFMLVFPLLARAQNENLDIVQDPICFVLRNEAPYSVYGSFSTDYYTRDDGIRARHRSNFKLLEAGSTNPETGYPTDRAEFCSYGPFWPGRKLELTLRTLVPIFSCRTRIDQGEIVIQGHFKPEGGTDTKALCFE